MMDWFDRYSTLLFWVQIIAAVAVTIAFMAGVRALETWKPRTGMGRDGFKTMPDGRRVFYPWGNLSKKGYLFDSDEAAGRFRLQSNILSFAGFIVMIMALVLRWGLLGIIAVGMVCTLINTLWIKWAIRRLAPFVDPEE